MGNTGGNVAVILCNKVSNSRKQGKKLLGMEEHDIAKVFEFSTINYNICKGKYNTLKMRYGC
jgi:hypothetical protein